MNNAGLFSTLFLDAVRAGTPCTDDAQGRLVTLAQSWQRRDASGRDALWRSFIKAALGNLGFVVEESPGVSRGLYSLFEDYGFQNRIAMLYLVEPGANLDDQSVGRFWPGKLISALRERKLNWGILTDGSTWRLYSTKSAKPYEDHVELDLAAALEAVGDSDDSAAGAYALFERFFHAESFVPVERDDYDSEKTSRLKAVGIKARKQKRAAAGDEESQEAEGQSDAEKEREAGIYLCRLDLDGEISEAILEARVKEPLLAQVDNVLRYICNGFIADTPRTGAAYTEEERREVFESSVKLLYRCLFLFYAEARRLLPSEDRHAGLYAPHSIQTLCREARKFRWNERNDNAGYDLWQQLKGLVQAVNEGDPSYGVMGYNGGLFDDQEEKFLGKHRLRNDFFAPALYWLAFVDPAEGSEEYAIPYQDLEVRHLGEMYEAILEYKVRLADTDYIRRRTKNGWQTLPAAGQKAQDGDTRIKAGDIFFGETALERKQSGSYYTPESLVRFLVGKAVIAPLQKRWESGSRERFAAYLEQARTGYDDAARRGAVRSAEEMVNEFVKREVLPYKVCDPAMGSGHFLVAAANLMADLVVELLAGIEPLSGVTSEKTGAPNHWRRLITRHCLYGADFNPLAVNLAKLALWLNCFARDHKLTFLDLHLRSGNSLIGLQDLSALRCIPARRKDTKRDKDAIEEAERELPLGLDAEMTAKVGTAAAEIAAILDLAEDDTDRQRDVFEEASRELQSAFGPLADLHTAYLMDSSIRPSDYARLLNHFASGKNEEELWPDLRETWERVCALCERHHFFHWPLEFPDVFEEQGGGFNATIGNPPWDVWEPQTIQFYSQYEMNFRSLQGAAAAKRIQELHNEHPALESLWINYQSLFEEAGRVFKEPEAFKFLTHGKIDLYRAFLERFTQILSKVGRIGILCPSGLYTDESAITLRKYFFSNTRIVCLYAFENRQPEIFPAVHPNFKIVTLVAEASGATDSFKCSFMQHDPNRLAIIDAKAPQIALAQVRRFSPKGLSLLEINTETDIAILDKMFADSPLLGDRVLDSWNAKQSQEFNVSSDRRLFNTTSKGRPVYEGKMISQFDHEFAPAKFWMEESSLKVEEAGSYWRELRKQKKPVKAFDHERYRVGFRRIGRNTDIRSLIATIPPSPVACTDGCVVFRRLVPNPETGEPLEIITAAQSVFLCGALNSFCCDFIIRFKVTTHLDMHFVYGLPIPRLGSGDARDATYFWPIVARALRLICTTDEYAALWTEVFPQLPAATIAALRAAPSAYGPAHEQSLRERLAESWTALDATWTIASGLHDRKPDRRDDGDRAQTRAELDALIAHLYGLTKAEFAYILDTFPVLRRKETAAFGEFQSKRKALEEYDRFTQ